MFVITSLFPVLLTKHPVRILICEPEPIQYPNIPMKANRKQNRFSRNGPGSYQIW